MKKGFDIFTPTYNRAYCIRNVYKSLLRQTYKEFTWVVIDDGSLDSTETLIKNFISEKYLSIIYHRQDNQGRFSAFNTARQFFQHELVAMVDSDDYLLPDGLKKISSCFESLGVNKWKYAGICSHFETKNGGLLGSPFPSGVTAEKIYVLYDRYGMQGDKFMVFRNDLLQRYKYPVYCGERFTGDSLVFNWINDEFPSILLQEKVAHREYFEDGITKNLLKNHLYSPNGMTDHYNEKIRVERYNMKNILKHGVGYVAYGLLAGRKLSRLLNESNRKWLTYLLIVPRILYFIRLRAIKKKLEK